MVTPDQVYRLDAARLRVLCERNGGHPPEDPLIHSKLTEGEQVVICHCGVPILRDTWVGLGGHCHCPARETRLQRSFPTANEPGMGGRRRRLSMGGRPHRLIVRARRRIFADQVVPRQQTVAQDQETGSLPDRSMERRVVDTGITAGILVLIGKVLADLLNPAVQYLNSTSAGTPIDDLAHVGKELLSLVLACSEIAIMAGLIFLLYNLFFAGPQEYRDPLPTCWHVFQRAVSLVVAWTRAIWRCLG